MYIFSVKKRKEDSVISSEAQVTAFVLEYDSGIFFFLHVNAAIRITKTIFVGTPVIIYLQETHSYFWSSSSSWHHNTHEHHTLRRSMIENEQFSPSAFTRVCVSVHNSRTGVADVYY